MTDVLRVIDEFNNKHNIKNVVEIITGAHIKRNSLCCPIHGGDNKNGASIHAGKNVFSCWTSDCGHNLSPWNFIKKYYGLNSFKEVALKCNELFNANIPIYEKREEKAVKKVLEVDNSYTVKRYLSEAKGQIMAELTENKHLLLSANTGLGKTYGITDLFKENKDMDYIFFLAPTRAIAEQVAKDYPVFNIFYGDDIVLPNSRFIVSTYHKIHMLDRAIEGEIKARAVLGEFPPMYAVVVDEVHEIMAKRKLLGNKARLIEEFIRNSDNSILMSANTDYINKTYKDTGLFNKYITVDIEEIKYNSENLNIYRLPKGKAQKVTLTINLIKDKVQAYNNVIFYEDSIEQLKEYETELKKLGIECITINSQNKNEDEEVTEEYKNIIENSKLNKTVVLTTSLINAGVNIKSDKVALIVKQDRNKFDIQKVEQFLARVRTEGNDLTLLLGSTDQEISKNIIPYDMFSEKLKRDTESIRIFFNQFIFNEYGLNIKSEEVNSIWQAYKNNEKYKDVKDIMYVENGLLKVDDPMLSEVARLDFERANYYNDKFILQQLINVKAKNKKISYLAAATIEKKEVIKEKSTLKEDLGVILEDSNSLKEFLMLVKKEIKGTQIKDELLKALYEKYKSNTVFKEMLSILRAMINNITDERVSKIVLFTNILIEYTKDTSKKVRNIEIENIKRVEVYNKTLPLGTSLGKIEGTGDIVYYVARKNFDCYIENNHKPTENTFKWALNDIVDLRGYKTLDNKKYISKDDKKVKITDVKEELKQCINSIYEVTEKGYIAKLK